MTTISVLDVLPHLSPPSISVSYCPMFTTKALVLDAVFVIVHTLEQAAVISYHASRHCQKDRSTVYLHGRYSHTIISGFRHSPVSHCDSTDTVLAAFSMQRVSAVYAVQITSLSFGKPKVFFCYS